jgi:dolichol-phosphate mannosyltransferase
MHTERSNSVGEHKNLPSKENNLVINTYSDDFSPQFALVMPIQNETAISEIISEIYHTVVKNNPYSVEVIISVDDSLNRTGQDIINLGTKLPVKASISRTKRCYAVSIQDSLALVSAPYVIVSDPENQLKLHDFFILKERLDQNTDTKQVIINGSRKIRLKDLHKEIISKAFQKLCSIVFDLVSINDIMSPFKLMSTAVAKGLASNCRYMNESFWIEFIVRACEKHVKIIDVQLQCPRKSSCGLPEYMKLTIPMMMSPLTELIKLKRELTGKNIVISILQTRSIRRLLTFALVGTSAAALTLFLTWLGVNFGLYYLLSAAIAIQLSIVWAFLLHERATFKDKIVSYELSKTLLRFLKYNISSLGGQAINLSTLFILTTAGIFYLHSEMVAILVAFIFNYTMSRKWVWKRE